MMPELRPEAIELVEKVKNFISDEVKPCLLYTSDAADE